MKQVVFSYFVALIFFVSCGKETAEGPSVATEAQKSAFLSSYYKTMNELEVSVFYEDGSEPYVGTRLSGKSYWDFFGENVSRLLKIEERKVQFNYPTKLEEMKKIAGLSKSEWTAEELKQRLDGFTKKAPSSDLGVINILFTSGGFKQNGEAKPGVLGVYIGGTNYTVIFKDAIKNIENRDGLRVARFSEQSVLVHEVGHLVGLVNNGVAPISDHHDSEHGAHCTNDKCVMFWLNEGATDMAEFVRKFLLTGDENLFDSQCLQDSHSQIDN